MRWAPLGSTWYDALQLNLTQRQWHGLQPDGRSRGSASWRWEAAATRRRRRSPNNVFDRAAQKGLAANSQPYIFVTSFNYITPRPRRKGARVRCLETGR